MVLNKVVSSLDWISDRLKKYALVVELELFRENIDLLKILREDIEALNKKSRYSEINLEWNEPQLEFSTDRRLTKLIKVTEFKHITYMKLVFVMNYPNIKKFSDSAITNIKQKLDSNKIYYTMAHDIFIAEKTTKGKVTYRYKSADIGKQVKPLKARIKSALWLEYGIDDKLSEERIDKIVGTFNRAKFETFWTNKDNEVIKVKH